MFKKKKFYVVQWKGSCGVSHSATVRAKNKEKAMREILRNNYVSKFISIKEVVLNEIMD